MNNITLIGNAGAGKSSIGVVLPRHWDTSFIDSDLIIQKEEKRTLSEIIEQDGRRDSRRLRTVECRHPGLRIQ